MKTNKGLKLDSSGFKLFRGVLFTVTLKCQMEMYFKPPYVYTIQLQSIPKMITIFRV